VPRGYSYQPSASLIHEIRMIAQSFFRHRTETSMFGQRPAEESSVLLCVSCVRNDAARPRKAVVIDNGSSLCKAHL
jgi:hypothetical protein